MDNFMDRLAQRITAQEIIKANSQAEAQELEKIKEQVTAYDECLKEVRRVNLKNEEALENMKNLTEQIRQMAQEALSRIEQVQGKEKEQLSLSMEKEREELSQSMEKMREEFSQGMETVREEFSQAREKALEEIKDILEKEKGIKEGAAEEEQEERKAAVAHMEDFVHKECVKVYRNVQAVVIDETKKQAEGIGSALGERKEKKPTLLFVVLIVLGFANLILQVMNFLGIF